MNGSLGQPTPIGIGTAAGTTLHAGFWGLFIPLEPVSTVFDVPPRINQLYGNLPNPFDPVTRIRFAVGEEAMVTLDILDVNGGRLRSLVSQTMSPGDYHVVWDGRDRRGRALASGVYFYRLRVGAFRSVKQMLLVK